MDTAVHTDVATEQLFAAISGWPHGGRLGVEANVLFLEICGRVCFLYCLRGMRVYRCASAVANEPIVRAEVDNR